MLSQKLKWIRKYNEPNTILDIGAGTGAFLEEASKKGWSIHGVEPSEKARKRALEKGVHLSKDLIAVKGSYEVITMWHVLEHVYDVNQYYNFLKNNLAETGTAFIAVPNFNSFDAKKYKQFWAAWDVPRHVYHFSKSAIQQLARENQMELIATRPLFFDAYYVSMLSEKYSGARFPFLKALIVGSWSNLIGWCKMEYSSHLYILKHEERAK